MTCKGFNHVISGHIDHGYEENGGITETTMYD